MRKYIWQKLLLLLGILLLAACHQADHPQEEGMASLQLTIKASGSTLHTRGVEDLNDDGTVSEEEIIMDGRKMYRLAVFLLDGSKVVSSKVLEADDPGFSNDDTEATVSFNNLDYTKTYKLYAVANYGEYNGLTGNLADVNDNNVASGLIVTASGNNLCNKSTPYPLTLTKDISLNPGVNTVSGELVRTYARIRINVRNQSSLNDLYITNLSFPAKFTQRSANLFIEGGTANVSPVVISADAITKFEANMMIPKLTDVGSVSETTIFDSYLLESTGGNYNYTLGVKYQGEETEIYEVNNTVINTINNIVDGGLYVIYNTNAQKYLYANGNNVGSGSSYNINGELNHNYVWRFNRTSDNKYIIESMGATGYFMQSSQMSGTKVPMVRNVGNNDYFTAATSGNNLRFQGTRNNYYIAVNGTAVYGNNSTSNANQRRYNFYLYKVEKQLVFPDIPYEETIPIRIIDKNTGEASPLTAIKRNDFINILVNVTYNEKKGTIEFEVSDWDKVNGDVTFD